MEYCTSQKGGKILFFEEYRYRKDRESEYSISWRCTEKNCRGRLLVTKNEMNMEPKSTTQHIYGPQAEKKDVNQFKEAIRITAASSSVLQPRQIIQANQASISDKAAVLMPSYEASRKTIQRIRKKQLSRSVGGGTGSHFNNVSEVKIEGEFKHTEKNENFLLFDTGRENRGRIIAFGTRQNLNFLKE